MSLTCAGTESDFVLRFPIQLVHTGNVGSVQYGGIPLYWPDQVQWSLTNGYMSYVVPFTNDRWPVLLSQRLADTTSPIAV